MDNMIIILDGLPAQSLYFMSHSYSSKTSFYLAFQIRENPLRTDLVE